MKTDKKKAKFMIKSNLRDTFYNNILAMSDSELTFAEKALYLYICEISTWKAGVLSKNYKTISKELGIKYGTLRDRLAKLEKYGYITRFYHYVKITGVDRPCMSAFIFPRKYYKELFDKQDILTILKNVEKEIDDSTSKYLNKIGVLKEDIKSDKKIIKRWNNK